MQVCVSMDVSRYACIFEHALVLLKKKNLDAGVGRTKAVIIEGD